MSLRSGAPLERSDSKHLNKALPLRYLLLRSSHLQLTLSGKMRAKYVNKISHVGGDGANGHTYYPVLIIGAGESGIAMGCNLKRTLGFDQFRIFERRSALGGTWHTNKYPGIACDVYVFQIALNHLLICDQTCDTILIFLRSESQMDIFLPIRIRDRAVPL